MKSLTLRIGTLKKSLWVIALAFLNIPQLWAAPATSCSAIDDVAKLPLNIERGKCYELQKDMVLPSKLAIAGSLLIKNGSRVEVAPQESFSIKRGGSLTVRGILSLEKQSILNLELMSSLINQGEVHVKEDAQIVMQKSATFKSIGPLQLYPQSLISLTDNSKLELSSTTIVDNALIVMKGGALENKGTFNLSGGTRILSSKNAVLANFGRLNLNKGSVLSLGGSTQLSNRRNINLEGELNFQDTASFVNYGIVDIAHGGSLSMQGGASLSNQHVVTLKGLFSMQEHATFENRNGFKIFDSGLFEIAGAARCVNRGSVYNEGGLSTSDEGVFDNKKYYFDKHSDSTQMPPASKRYPQGGI